MGLHSTCIGMGGGGVRWVYCPPCCMCVSSVSNAGHGAGTAALARMRPCPWPCARPPTWAASNLVHVVTLHGALCASSVECDQSRCWFGTPLAILLGTSAAEVCGTRGPDAGGDRSRGRGPRATHGWVVWIFEGPTFRRFAPAGIFRAFAPKSEKFRAFARNIAFSPQGAEAAEGAAVEGVAMEGGVSTQ